MTVVRFTNKTWQRQWDALTAEQRVSYREFRDAGATHTRAMTIIRDGAGLIR